MYAAPARNLLMWVKSPCEEANPAARLFLRSFATKSGAANGTLVVRRNLDEDQVWRDGRDCVAVTHRGVQRAALGLATGWDFLAPPPLALARDAILMLRLSSRGRARLDAPPLLFMGEGLAHRQVRNTLPEPGGTGCGGLSRF